MNPDREEAITLQLLSAIDARSDVTQRYLADRLGVALGLANSYLRRCVRKGLVKITQAPANRYLYYLTPQGFAEKSRLTASYLSVSFDFYRQAGASMRDALQLCEANGIRRLLLAGISDVAEIAYARSHDAAVEIVGTYAPGSPRTQYLGRPVWSSALPDIQYDSVILTALDDCAAFYRGLSGVIDPTKIIIPSLLAPLLDIKKDVAG